MASSHFSKGPLTKFRNAASCDWRKMKIFLEGKENVDFGDRIAKCLENDPVFAREWKTTTVEEARVLVHKRWSKLIEYDFVGLSKGVLPDVAKLDYFLRTLEPYDAGLTTYCMMGSIVPSTIISLQGSKKHQPLVEALLQSKIIGSLCLTELSHGSNTKAFQTTAIFDNGELVFNTPHPEAMKCWSANLGSTATHSIIFAQLIVNGSSHGVHTFVVQVRDLKTLEPLPGITIGSVGEIVGAWNGVGTGWMMFRNYKTGLEALLDRNCSLTKDGVYKSKFKNPAQQHGAALSALAFSRIGVLGKGGQACEFAATIAIRYSFVRRQFGPTDDEEIPVIEYPLQKHRLFPILANAFVIALFHRKFSKIFAEHAMRTASGERSQELAELGKDIHVLSVSCKAVTTWMGVKALSEARLACGGHGYLKSSRLNDYRNDLDPMCTYEGDNHLIIQQAAFYLLGQAKQKSASSPLNLTSALKKPVEPLKTLSGDIIQDASNAHKWLIQHLIKETGLFLKNEMNLGKSAFEARNNAQVAYIQPLSVAFAEFTMFEWAYDISLKAPEDLKRVLVKLCKIYILANLEKHIPVLYMGNYCTGPDLGKAIQEELSKAESDLTPEAISLCDVIAPSDFLLHSSLGSSDGRVYERLFNECQKTANSRPTWWADLVTVLNKSKL